VGPFDECQLVRIGDEHLFPDVADDLIRKDDDGNPEPLREVEGLDRMIEHLLGCGRTEHNERVVPVGTVTRLVEITLGRRGGLTRCRPPPHHVDDDARGLHCHGQTDRFLHEAETRTARGGHRLRAAPGGPDNRHKRRDFILHLQTKTIDQRKTSGHDLQNLGGRRDRIAAVKTATRQDGRLHASLVSQHNLDTTFFHGSLSSFSNIMISVQ
jgi:hypothetical protein